MGKRRIAGIGLVGIAGEENLAAILASKDFELAALVASDPADAPSVPVFATTEELYAQRPDLDVLSVGVPPVTTHAFLQGALAAGKHVLMQNPVQVSLSEYEHLRLQAQHQQLVLFQGWHSRQYGSIAEAKAFLAEHGVSDVHVDWQENVRRNRPGDEQVWQPGGWGVCASGLDALAILTEIMPFPVFVDQSRLTYPANRQGPVRVEVGLMSNQVETGTMSCVFDWLSTDEEKQSLSFTTNTGRDVVLDRGGKRLVIDGTAVREQPGSGYDALYARFADLLARNESDVDDAPFHLMCDIFFKGALEPGVPFDW